MNNYANGTDMNLPSTDKRHFPYGIEIAQVSEIKTNSFVIVSLKVDDPIEKSGAIYKAHETEDETVRLVLVGQFKSNFYALPNKDFFLSNAELQNAYVSVLKPAEAINLLSKMFQIEEICKVSKKHFEDSGFVFHKAHEKRLIDGDKQLPVLQLAKLKTEVKIGGESHFSDANILYVTSRGDFVINTRGGINEMNPMTLPDTDLRDIANKIKEAQFEPVEGFLKKNSLRNFSQNHLLSDDGSVSLYG